MQFLVDFHLHSHYAYATSKKMNLLDLYYWGKVKGLFVMGTGDCTHPGYFEEIREQLEPAELGLFGLKPKLAAEIDGRLPESVRGQAMRFLLTTEVSCIYQRYGRLRKVHHIVVLPSVKAVAEMNRQLSRYGDLAADGRPTLTLDSYDLLQMLLGIDERIVLIPAHAWTPWFGIFGSRSGFDSLEEAFGDLSSYVFAIETGLSSDPAMNRKVVSLDGITLVSNSDAHSPQKIGREATMLDCELSYEQIVEAIKSNDERLVGTIEFFPEEGKYHFDGHRKCGVCLSPTESSRLRHECPECGRQLTLGVLNRVEELAAVDGETVSKSAEKQVEYIIPLTELIAEVYGLKSTGAKKVQKTYMEMIEALGSEFEVLRNVPLKNMSHFEGVAEAIEQMRVGKVEISPGFDGEFGKVSLKKAEEVQLSLV